MAKQKYFIGDVINDFTLINIRKENRIIYKIKCNICGEIKDTMNLNLASTTHTLRTCRQSYINSFIGKEYGDFFCIDAYMNKRLFLVLKCRKCGIERSCEERALKKQTNKHGFVCALQLRSLIDDYSKPVYDRLKVKHNNMRYRVSNPNYHHYETYKNYKIDYWHFSDFVLTFYQDYKNACDNIGIDNVYIDRIDNSKGYEIGNIQFVDAYNSAINRSTQVKFEIDGEEYNDATLAAKRYHVSHSYLSRVLQKLNTNESFNFRGHNIKKLS